PWRGCDRESRSYPGPSTSSRHSGYAGTRAPTPSRSPGTVRLSLAPRGAAPPRAPDLRRLGRPSAGVRELLARSRKSPADLRDTVGVGHPKRTALPRDRGEGPPTRDRQPAQIPVLGEHEP